MNLYFLLRSMPRPDEIIAVDLTSLWTAQKLSSPVHFLSLEIHEKDPLEKCIQKKRLSSVIIQSPERYRYYFPEEDVRVFFVQNAPVYREFSAQATRKRLIYNGTAVPEFGVFHCIRFIDASPAYALTIKGAVPAGIKKEIEKTYPHLLENERLIIDSSYVENKDLANYLAQFRIGFCFYDLSIKKINTFNYKTAPSGKLFAYLASGTPVIANNIPGLSAVTEFNCGVLINDMNAESILDAVRKIEDNYGLYSANCILAAKHYSFDKTIEPFTRFIHSR